MIFECLSLMYTQMNVLLMFTTVISMPLTITQMVHLVANVTLDIVVIASTALVSKNYPKKLY